MNKSLRERRRESALAIVARLTEKREATIASLVAIDLRLRRLRRQVARYDKAETKPPAVKVEAALKPLPEGMPPISVFRPSCNGRKTLKPATERQPMRSWPGRADTWRIPRSKQLSRRRSRTSRSRTARARLGAAELRSRDGRRRGLGVARCGSRNTPSAYGKMAALERSGHRLEIQPT